MNLIVLEPADFVGEDRVRLDDRRLTHARKHLKVAPGDVLKVGLLDEQILVQDEEGGIRLVTVGPDGPTESPRFQGLDGEVALNLPVVAAGRLLLRNERELVCYDLRPEVADR